MMQNKKQARDYIILVRKGENQDFSTLSYFYGVLCAFLIATYIYGCFWCMLNGLYGMDVNFKIFGCYFLISFLMYNIYLLKSRNMKYSRWLLPIITVVFLIIFYLRIKEIIYGFQIILHKIIDNLNEYYYVSIVKPTLISSKRISLPSDIAIYTICLFLGIIIIFFVSNVYYTKKSSSVLLLLTLPIQIVVIAGGILPEMYPLLCYGLSALVLVGSKGFRVGYQTMNIQKSVASLLLAIICMVTFLMSILFPPTRYMTGYTFEATKGNVQNKITEIMTKEYWDKKNISDITDKLQGVLRTETTDGNLNETGRIRFQGTEILKISLQKPHPTDLYLKGFVGDYYDGSSWTKFGNNNSNAYYEQFLDYFSFYNYNLERPREIRLTGGNSEVVSIKVENLIGEKTYIPYMALNSYRIDEEGLIQLLENKEGFQFQQNLNQLATDYIDYEEGLQDIYIDPSDTMYHTYLDFIYQSYTNTNYMPSMITDHLIDEILSNYGASSEADMIEKINAVKHYLTNNFTYTLAPTKKGENEDFIDHFLTTKRGYCVHYATTAVMLLRKMGIPARYVEGYMISQQIIRTQFNRTMSIKLAEDSRKEFYPYEGYAKDSDGHAWVEVFIDGLGFVPVEVTFSNRVESTEQSQNNSTPTPQEETETPTETPTKLPTETPTPSIPANSSAEQNTPNTIGEDSKQKSKVNSAVVFIIHIVVVIAVIIGSLELQRYIRNRSFYKKLETVDIRNQIMLQYSKLAVVLSLLRIHDDSKDKEGFANEIFEKTANLKVDRLTKEECMENIDILFETYFSNKEIDERKKEIFFAFYGKLVFSCVTKLNVLKRLYLRYFLAL